MKIIEKLYSGIIIAFFMAILLLVGFYTVLGSCYLNYYEVTYFVKDNAIVNIVAVLVILFLLFWICERSKAKLWLEKLDEDDAKCRKLRQIILGIVWLLSMIWILSTQCVHHGDQYWPQLGAAGLYNGDYSLFQEGEYLQIYPNQVGLVWLEYALTCVFGECNYLLIQVINTFMVVSFYWSLTEICRLLGWKNRVQLGVLASALLFYPLMMYCSFSYGNWIGLALAAAAIKHELACINSFKWYHFLLTVLEICLAILVKQNYLIMFIGVILSTLFECIRRKRLDLLLLVILLLGGYILQTKLPVLGIKAITGQSLDHGCSSWSWIAMGLQEGERAEGWYNGYNRNSYNDNNYDPDTQSQEAKAYIIDRMKEFLQKPGKALRFFSKKTASQWANPNYGSFWIVNSRKLALQPSRLVKWILSAKGEYILSWHMDIFNIFIILGSICYCIFSYKRESFAASLVIPMIFVGGFVFHLFWEAKVQYTISYYVFLFPFAFAGISDFYEKLSAAMSSKELASRCRSFFRRRRLLLIYCIAVILAILLVYSGARLNWLGKDTELFMSEIAECAK